jgi:hypothetical protein
MSSLPPPPKLQVVQNMSCKDCGPNYLLQSIQLGESEAISKNKRVQPKIAAAGDKITAAAYERLQ